VDPLEGLPATMPRRHVHVASGGESTAVLTAFSSWRETACYVFFPGASQSQKKYYLHLLYICSLLQNHITTKATRIVEWCVPGGGGTRNVYTGMD